MYSTRQTQPYRRGSREPGAALMNMLRGRTVSGYNPMDVQRAAQRLMNAGKRSRKRPQRPPRPPRPPRA